jgi:sulfite reductase (NADPH) flavoprotein alpha-component
MNPPDDKPAYGPKNPFPALFLERRPLGSASAEKQTIHIALGLSGAFPVECGGTIGVVAENDPAAVAAFLKATRLDGNTPVIPPRSAVEMPLAEVLQSRLSFEIAPTPALLSAAALSASSPTERKALEESAALPAPQFAEYAASRHLREVFSENPSVELDAALLAKLLPPLAPRLYSLANSPLVRPDVAEFAVACVEYPLAGRVVRGVVSGYLCERCTPGKSLVNVFPAKGILRLPPPETDLIMVGPGTGVAPFRAFLQHREKTGAKGRNWLFYGHRHESEDFYYREELRAWEQSGLLTHLSLAWSRDGAEKRYVQNLLWENRDVVWRWFEGGATFCVCGSRLMAREVEGTLARIAVEKGACEGTPESASAWLKARRAEKRLLVDAY